MKRIWVYNVAVFISAFLLFQIQPIVSKAILPVFGGSYQVWGACMVFFQGFLFLGYLYAHGVQRLIGVKRYSKFHIIIMAIPLVMFPFHFNSIISHSINGLSLAVAVFSILIYFVGLPFLVLSTTSLILQSWLSESDLQERANPYVLYSASNLGSMLSLLTYPVLVEPFLTVTQQCYIWWSLYLVMLLFYVFCVPKQTVHQLTSGTANGDGNSDKTGICSNECSENKPSIGNVFSWLFLSFAACSMLLATTNVITFDIASVPFLWILPLSVYLLSFVLAFTHKPYYPKWSADFLSWVIIVGFMMTVMAPLHLSVPPVIYIILHLVVLFGICMNCAGALIMSKPVGSEYLTMFYLFIALGGMLGSLLVSWLIPLVSKSLVEYPLSMIMALLAVTYVSNKGTSRISFNRLVELLGYIVLIGVLLIVLPWGISNWSNGGGIRMNIILAVIGLPLSLIIRRYAKEPYKCAIILVFILVLMSWTEQLAMGAGSVHIYRNYYGIYRIFDKDNVRYLQHGSTEHGRQYISGPKKNIPLAYYHPSTPAAGVLGSKEFDFKDIGMIGLGSGALTTYAGAGHNFTIFELDPDNLAIARKYFTYLDLAEEHGVKLDFVFGDGRVSLRKRKKHSLDLLIVDAFNSGSIPVHLLTVEAFEKYFEVLKDDGLLLIHVSNRALYLNPIVYSNAKYLDLASCEKSNENNILPDAESTSWMAVSRNSDNINILVSRLGWELQPASLEKLPRPWTDRYSDIFGAMF